MYRLFNFDFVAEWRHFGKGLLTRLIVCSRCSCLFEILVACIFRFGFEGRILIIFVSVPGDCLALADSRLQL